KTEISPRQVIAQKTYVFTEPTTIDYVYKILPKSYYDGCVDICATCDYKITLTATQRDDTFSFRDELNIAGAVDSFSWECSGSEVSTSGTYMLPTSLIGPGTFDLTVFIELNNKNEATNKYYIDSTINVLHRKLDASIAAGGWTIPGAAPYPC